MNDELSEQQSDEVLKSLDKLIKEGPWDKSNFLASLGKNLRNVRNEFASHLDKPQHVITETGKTSRTVQAGQKEVFISLYSAVGMNLQAWERIIINLPNQMISRPIYEREEDAQALIRSKENKLNEGYISIFVNETDILTLPAEKIPSDKLGNPLLTLKDKSIKPENIIRFIHASGNYEFIRGRLVRK